MRKLLGIIILQTFIFCMSFGLDLIYPSNSSYSSSVLSSNVVTNSYSGGIVANGTITANKFVGDGSGLTGIPSTLTGSFIGTVNVVGTVSASALQVNGLSNLSGGIVANGTITANKFVGDGSGLTGIPASANINGNLNVNGTISGSALQVNGNIGFTGLKIGQFNFNTGGGHGYITNTGVGYNALNGNSSGQNYNTAFGSSSLTLVTSDQYNTAVGASTLENQSGGGSNTAVGAYAGQKLTTGSGNSFFGMVAGQNLLSGIKNTAIGAGSLRENITSAYNTAVGVDSLGYTRLGTNTAIGYQAGHYYAGGANPATSLNSCIYVGAFTQPKTPTATNEIVMGYNVAGEGDNTTVIGNSSTTLTHLYGTISGNALQINGNSQNTGYVSANYVIGTGGTVTPSAVEGAMWFNKTSKKLSYYNGSAWVVW